jgi:hypothetical protein
VSRAVSIVYSLQSVCEFYTIGLRSATLGNVVLRALWPLRVESEAVDDAEGMEACS